MKFKSQIVLAVALALFLGACALGYHTQPVYGSVGQADEYQATTTFAASTPVVRVLKPGYGSLAQVTITGANTGTMTFYDATTSDITKRAASLATSSILVADFPASVAAGTYTFDLHVNYGLLLVTSGLTATSTITYR